MTKVQSLRYRIANHFINKTKPLQYGNNLTYNHDRFLSKIYMMISMHPISILELDKIGDCNINTGTTLLLKTIIN